MPKSTNSSAAPDLHLNGRRPIGDWRPVELVGARRAQGLQCRSRQRQKNSSIEGYYEAKHGKNPHDPCGQLGQVRFLDTASSTERGRTTLRPRRTRTGCARVCCGGCSETGRNRHRYHHRWRAGQIGLLQLHYRTIQRLRAQARRSGDRETARSRSRVSLLPRVLCMVRAYRRTVWRSKRRAGSQR